MNTAPAMPRFLCVKSCCIHFLVFAAHTTRSLPCDEAFPTNMPLEPKCTQSMTPQQCPTYPNPLMSGCRFVRSKTSEAPTHWPVNSCRQLQTVLSMQAAREGDFQSCESLSQLGQEGGRLNRLNRQMFCMTLSPLSFSVILFRFTHDNLAWTPCS